MDELIGPLLKARWFGAIENSKNPLGDLKRALPQFVQEDINSSAWIQGCPLNNLALEMSPLDKGFRQRLDKLYVEWRKSLGAGLSAGIKAGKVRKDVSTRNAAALIVAAQMGIWGTAKISQSEPLMIHAGAALCEYLDSLKA